LQIDHAGGDFQYGLPLAYLDGVKKLAILASGNGTNAEAILQHFKNHPEVRVVMLLSNNPNAFALERAKKFGIPARVFSRDQFRGPEVAGWLKEAGVTHLILAGFLWLVPPSILETFPNRIVNIHPALLPRYGGKGMYGERVHQAVKASGDTQTGITIHLVNEKFDEGRTLFQATCDVTRQDTPETIAEKVHALEHKHFPTVIERWALSES